MNLDDLYFPIDLVAVVAELKSCEVVSGSEFEGKGFVVSEGLLCKLLVLAGAKMNKEIELNSVSIQKNEYLLNIDVEEIVNEEIGYVLPLALLEVSSNEEGNAIRCIMNWKAYSLKEIGDRYGGKSAASNLANFLSKTDFELMRTRKSTMAKIANSLDVALPLLQSLIEFRIRNANQE